MPPPFLRSALPSNHAGLQAYSVIRAVACAVNNSTDTYCYVDVLQAASAADLYLYRLPLGLPLPNATVPSCDACVQRVKGAFAEGGAGVDTLTETYAEVGTVNRACGATQAAGSGAAGLRAWWAVTWSLSPLLHRRCVATLCMTPPKYIYISTLSWI